jgi:soluble cytochrome b562
VRSAVRELQKVVKAAQDQKKFKDGVPDVAVKARSALDKLKSEGLGRAEEAKASKKDLIRLRSDYGGIPEVRDRIKELLKKLDG